MWLWRRDFGIGATLAGCCLATIGLSSCATGGSDSEPPADEVVITPPADAPDLVVDRLSVSDDMRAPGDAFTLRATIRNRGDAQSDATTVRYYRSTDTTVSSSDTQVSLGNVPTLAASRTADVSIELTAPRTTGTHYYGACADAVADESDTGNNCSTAVVVTVREAVEPDLVVVGVSVSDETPDAGGSFTLSATVRNRGDGSSPATTLRYYRSSDDRITSSDTQVGTDPAGVLAASDTSAESVSLVAPSTAGTYYYGACVDAVADESDTGNNCSTAVVVTVREAVEPDLVVVGVSVSDETPDAGGSFTLSATVRNRGDGSSPATTLRYYRSSDDRITSSDTQVGTDPAGVLGASDTSAESVSLVAPSTAGTYYYGACVDAVADESDTGNNCSQAVAVTVGADDGGGSGRFGVGDSLPGVPSSGTFIPARLSGGVSLSAGGGGTTIDFNNGGTIELEDGTTYTCQAAGGCQVVDGVVTRGTIVGGGGTGEGSATGESDLVVEGLSVSDETPDAGGSFTLFATVRNRGDGSSPATTLRYYRSSDDRITSSDTQVGTDPVGVLAGSNASAESVSLVAPSTAGTYYYGACVDAVADESDTGNNCSQAAGVTVRRTGDGPPPAPTVTVESATQIKIAWDWRFEANERFSFDFAIREQGDAEWASNCQAGLNPRDAAVEDTLSVTLTGANGIEPSTTYEARYRYRNVASCAQAADPTHAWSAIAEGTTLAGGSTSGDGYCRDDDEVRAGDSCDVYDRRLGFDVDSNGVGCLRGGGFLSCSGRSQNWRNLTANGQTFTFVASSSGNVWTIEDVEPEPPQAVSRKSGLSVPRIAVGGR